MTFQGSVLDGSSGRAPAASKWCVTKVALLGDDPLDQPDKGQHGYH